jgi:hypothetical protein
MSELQLSLLAIGAVVVAAVYCYNWMQERGLRRRMQQAFGAAHDDVLLKGGAEPAHGDGRREPQLAPREAVTNRHEEPATGTQDFDAELDYVAEIEADGPISDSVIGELAGRVAACGKPVRITGLDARSGAWEEVARGRGGRYRALRLALQLVNRSGPVNGAQLATFCDAVRGCAAKVPAAASIPDTQAAMKTAREIDAFCAEVDVAVGVNVVAPDGASFQGADIRAAAEGAGFKLEPDGVFHFRDGQRHTLFTLDNHEPAPFLPESIKGLSTGGITLLLDVPRVANGVAVLDRMLEVARHLAATLGGTLVDDNRAPFSDAGIARIKGQVRSIHAAMEQRDMPAGGPRASRLFS